MTPNVLLLATRLGIEVMEADRPAFCDAVERLFEQASLVLSLTLPQIEAGPGMFEP